MSTLMTEEAVQVLQFSKEIEIAAPIAVAFDAVLEELGPGGEMPDGSPFPMKIEAWPGGRWFRDLGANAGHLWGHVQVIKPPALLELRGPMFMSYPATNFVQYRLTAEGDKTRLKLTHQAMGLIPPDHREGVTEGWTYTLQQVQKIAQRLLQSRKSR